jgi:hypothetical protein
MEFAGDGPVPPKTEEAEIQKRLGNSDTVQGVQPSECQSGGMTSQGVGLHQGDTQAPAAQQVAGHAAHDASADDHDVSGLCSQGTFSAF